MFSLYSLPENEDPCNATETAEDLLKLALDICERLATDLDRIRVNYWRYRSRQLVAIARGSTADNNVTVVSGL